MRKEDDEHYYQRHIERPITLQDHLLWLHEHGQLKAPPDWLSHINEGKPFQPADFGPLEGYTVTMDVDESREFPVVHYTQLNMNHFRFLSPNAVYLVDRNPQLERIYYSGKVSILPPNYNVTIVRPQQIRSGSTAAGLFTLHE